MWVNIQRITGVPHCANVVWPDLVDFPFDGRTVHAEATFVSGSEILIGTQLLRQHRLEIHFPAQTVVLEPVAQGHP
jgi:hypothetical protein